MDENNAKMITNSLDHDKNKCRICLQFQPKLQMIPFFKKYFEDFSLAKIFSNIISYEVEEDNQLPMTICEVCKTSIIAFNNLLSVFNDTELYFQKKIAKNEIKNEIKNETEYIGEADKDSFLNKHSICDDEYLDYESIDYVKSEHFEEDDSSKINSVNAENIKKERIVSDSGSLEYNIIKSFKYTCECGDCFLHKSGFRQHMQFKHNKLLEEYDFESYSEEIKLKIPVGFPNNVEYVSSKAAVRRNKLQCRICTVTFLNEQEVKVHEVIHKTFICDHCGAAFLKKSYLADHLYTHSEERRYTCKICEKSFKQRYTYIVHKKCHDVARNYVCDTCGADFKTSHTLRTHIQIKHSNIRNFSCPNCNLKFNLKSTLSKHIIRKHTTDREKSFVCSICGAAYLNKNTLTRHIDEKHLGKAKNYSCTICENKIYVMKKGLRIHMLKKHGLVYQ